MNKHTGAKTGAFKKTAENQHQTYGVRLQQAGALCVAPTPVQQFLDSTYGTELDAWKAIIVFRVKNPSALQWELEQPERCSALLIAEFESLPLHGNELAVDWLVFKAGTEVRDVRQWLCNAFSVPG